MSKESPNTEPFERLHRLIEQEEERTRQSATKVRISKKIARDLGAMVSEDWYAASKGFSDLKRCRELANDFLRRGEAAATGLRISEVGPVLEVAEEPSAPEVEIVVGISRPR